MASGVTSTDPAQTTAPRAIAPPAPSVAIAAGPPVLADCLRLLLDGDAEVTLLGEDSCRWFDVLLTLPGHPRAPAGLVIELDPSPASRGGGRTRAGSHGQAELLGDLDAVLARIRSLDAGDRSARREP